MRTMRERRRARQPDKSDPTDAVAIAWITAREDDLPPVAPGRAGRGPQLLVNHRDQKDHASTAKHHSDGRDLT